MTKPISSIALMMLWEEGLFALNDPVAKFLPEFADVRLSTTGDASGRTGDLVAPSRAPTIRQMLSHTAGLANSYIGNREAYREAMRSREGDTLEAYVHRLAAIPLNYEPGTAWQYSHATDVVARLVEVISGMPFEDYLEQRILGPLDMTDTAHYLDERRGTRLAAQYRPGDDNTIVLADPAGVASRIVTGPKTLYRGAGGMVSTAADYVRLQQLMLSGGALGKVRLLGRKTVELMFTNHIGNLPMWLGGPGMGFGLGYSVVLDRGAAATPSTEGTVGWGGAYCTVFWIDPEEELIGILMTQVRPYTHLNIRTDFRTLVYQAIVD